MGRFWVLGNGLHGEGAESDGSMAPELGFGRGWQGALRQGLPRESQRRAGVGLARVRCLV
jgi:hypothetical protein